MKRLPSLVKRRMNKTALARPRLISRPVRCMPTCSIVWIVRKTRLLSTKQIYASVQTGSTGWRVLLVLPLKMVILKKPDPITGNFSKLQEEEVHLVGRRSIRRGRRWRVPMRRKQNERPRYRVQVACLEPGHSLTSPIILKLIRPYADEQWVGAVTLQYE